MILFTRFDYPPPLPPSVPLASPGAAVYLPMLLTALVVRRIWRSSLPEWFFPLRGKWLRFFLSGLLLGAFLCLYYLLCLTGSPLRPPLLPW